MFDFERIGVYKSMNRPNDGEFLKITSIGCEPIDFIDANIINADFKKINIVVLVQKGNSVILDDDTLPHATLTERDLNSVFGLKTNDAILREAAKRSAFNAGTTVQAGTLRLIGKVEDENEVYFFYTGLSGRFVREQVATTPISTLTKDHFLGLCKLRDIN